MSRDKLRGVPLDSWEPNMLTREERSALFREWKARVADTTLEMSSRLLATGKGEGKVCFCALGTLADLDKRITWVPYAVGEDGEEVLAAQVEVFDYPMAPQPRLLPFRIYASRIRGTDGVKTSDVVQFRHLEEEATRNHLYAIYTENDAGGYLPENRGALIAKIELFEAELEAIGKRYPQFA